MTERRHGKLEAMREAARQAEAQGYTVRWVGREGPYRNAAGERCPDAIVEMLRERSRDDAMARAILDTIRNGVPWQDAVAEGLRFALEGQERLMGELERVLTHQAAPLVVKLD